MTSSQISQWKNTVSEMFFIVLHVIVFVGILALIWISSRPGSSVDPMIEVEREAEEREKAMRSELYRIEQEDIDRIMRESLEDY